METTNIYSRKISSKEAQNGLIFILKNKLNFFPKYGSKFILTADGVEREVKVKSYPCTCRGPDLPHEHYFIPWEGLKTGNEVKIIKNTDRYKIEIN